MKPRSKADCINDLASKLESFRFDPRFHLGLGDIRLCRGDGDDVVAALRACGTLIDLVSDAYAFLEVIEQKMQLPPRHIHAWKRRACDVLFNYQEN